MPQCETRNPLCRSLGWQRHGLSNAAGSSMTLTVTSMLLNDEAGPMNVPDSGSAFRWSHATATRIRLRFPTRLLVGSKSTHPAPGKYACIQPCVVPPSTGPARSVSGTKMYPLTEASGETEGTNGFHHEHREVSTAAASALERLGRTLDTLLTSTNIDELLLDAAHHRVEQDHRRCQSGR